MLNKKKLLAEPKLLGRWGQKQSEKFLRRKGFKTIERNFLCKTGEIDLFMAVADKNDGQLVFVEVNTTTI